MPTSALLLASPPGKDKKTEYVNSQKKCAVGKIKLTKFRSSSLLGAKEGIIESATPLGQEERGRNAVRSFSKQASPSLHPFFFSPPPSRGRMISRRTPTGLHISTDNLPKLTLCKKRQRDKTVTDNYTNLYSVKKNCISVSDNWTKFWGRTM